MYKLSAFVDLRGDQFLLVWHIYLFCSSTTSKRRKLRRKLHVNAALYIP